MSTSDIVAQLYKHTPVKPLFHYTSLGSLLGIIESSALYATDIRFLSDAAELGHMGNLLLSAIGSLDTLDTLETRLLVQLEDWMRERLTGGSMLFVVCFTENGNLLSQWRSYTKPSKGVSLGFDAAQLTDCASKQAFQFGRCVYQLEEQRDLAKRFVEQVVELGHLMGETTDVSKRHPNNSFHDVFEKIEDDLLRVAALLKHNAFHEEQEWRAVSRIVTNYVNEPIEYREGNSTLVPFINFSLPRSDDRRIDLDTVVVGPTPRANNSIMSVSNYLSKHGASPRRGTMYCQIPYRTW
jgi:hypothetical protein